MKNMTQFSSHPADDNHIPRDRFLLFTLFLLTSFSFAAAGASATELPNWNQFTREEAGHGTAQTFAYLVSENIVVTTLTRQIVPVLSFACMGKHLTAAITFNELGIKRIHNVDFTLDSKRVDFASWAISGSNKSLDYRSDVPAMIRSFYGHHTLRMRLVGQSGRIISATFDVNHSRLGTRDVRKACEPVHS